MSESMSQFSALVCSDVDYEKMVVDLNFENGRVAILSCDKGLDKAEIQIMDRFEERIIWSFGYQDFITALNKAYKKLLLVNDESQ